ncbi:hypothetical protein EJ02DRAFT_146467 [Clathrospora elynae]|uniref:Uncharacterized protein n=1 Tax=Clathrospora elynae TaxID=706981 RepID=A0A6A5SXM8_9PLEO|nr:hypothetical protein EJ02DRAFT_146467 [Clathrospora elynae]
MWLFSEGSDWGDDSDVDEDFDMEESLEQVIDDEYRFLAKTRWFFSAAAIAIHYLEQHLQQRKMMRHVVLQENRISASNPKAHMQVFPHTCRENPSFRLVQHVGLWSCMSPPWMDGHNQPRPL